jgi:hypothetical protein
MRSSKGFVISGMYVDMLPELTTEEIEDDIKKKEAQLAIGIGTDEVAGLLPGEALQMEAEGIHQEEIGREKFLALAVSRVIDEMTADIECCVGVLKSEIAARRRSS